MLKLNPVKAAAFATAAFLLLCSALALPAAAQTAGAKAIPHLVSQNGKHALMVDGAPFIILGGQANNSSNYPAMLPHIWEALDDANANTLLINVAWEQIEPVEGQFDFSFVDTLITEARKHNKRLVILWFGTWKNTAPSYTPEWVKGDNVRFPRLRTQDGEWSYALSPHFRSTLEADKRAYVELMKHIKKIDGNHHTVIMMQVENEVGVYRQIRDYGPEAEALFNGPVPQALLTKYNKQPGTWRAVFGTNADEYFHAWHMAAYIDEIAAAGKAIYPLPAYVNAALRAPFGNHKPGEYASGGPTWNVIDIYKAAAPHLDLLAPDIYLSDSHQYEGVLKQYNRPDNALFVAESGNKATYARFAFSVFGQGGIGVDPFGFDYTDYTNHPLGAETWDKDAIAPFGVVNKLFGSMMREWARLSFESQVWGVSEPDDHSAQTLDLNDRFVARVTYRQWQFGLPEWDPENKNGYPKGSEIPSGGAVIAKLSDDEFLVAGHKARVTFDTKPETNANMMLMRVEEGSFVDGQWVMRRVWNGDQTDYGFNFTGNPVILKVKVGSYPKR